MPKATLEFNLPEELNEYTMVNKASEYYCCLWDIAEKLRGILKYGHNYKSVDELVEELTDMIWDSVNLDEVA